MKKILAVIVSIFWLAVIIGVPALVMTGNAAQFIPAPIQEQLTRLGIQELLDGFGTAANLPTPAVDEPIVKAVIPEPTVEPTAAPIEPPLPEPTAILQAEATVEPATESTAASAIATAAEPSIALPVAVRGQAELRTGPGLDFDAVGLVDAGATILVSAQDVTGEWFQMDNGNWIPGEALASKPPVPIVLPTPAVTPEAATPETPATPEPAAPASPATPVVVRINADANLRSGPGGTFERVGGANFDSDVTVVGKFPTDNWYLLDDGSWIFGELLDSAPDVPQVNADGTPVGSAPAPTVAAPAPATIPATIPATVGTPVAGAATPTANILANLRAAPNTNAAITGTAQPDAALSLVGKNAAGDWLKLESGSWIFAELVDNAPADLPVATEDAPTGNTGTSAVTTPAVTTPAVTTPAVTTTATTPITTTAVTTGTVTGGTTTASAAVDANLRGGPGTTFDLVGSITAGTALIVVGRNVAGDWMKLENGSWIFGELVTNAPADLPVVNS